MRLHFGNLDIPKAAAKRLVRLSPSTKLSRVQQVLAQSIGYRDWHELAVVSAAGKPAGAKVPSPADAAEIILNIAHELALSEGDTQYALLKARLLPAMPLSSQLEFRAMIWRQQLFGPPQRRKTGTIVKVKAHGETRAAYLRKFGRPCYVLYDTGPGACADFEIITPRQPMPDFVPSRLWMPYGYWTLQDGSEVIFARDYLPLWRISADGVERLKPWYWIKGIIDEFHFAKAAGTVIWSRERTRDLALHHLESRRIFELPVLVDAMPHLLAADIESMDDGLRRLYERQVTIDAVPAYASDRYA